MKSAAFGILWLAATICIACAQPFSPDGTEPAVGLSAERSVVVSHDVNAGRASTPDESCSFSRGTTTCVSTVSFEEKTTHQEISGCSVGPFFPPVPGRRTRTFDDTYLVTVQHITYYRGRSNHAYASEDRETSRVLESSTQVSDKCEAI
jgi:hypothetical protein